MNTTMIDYIKIDEKCFWDFREHCERNNMLEEKIHTILDKLPCFNDYNAFHSYKMRKSHSFPVRKKLFNETQRQPSEREVTSALNKISKSNYKKIAADILKLSNKNSLEMITKAILNKCQTQVCFLELYINLLNDIYINACNIEVKQIMNNILSQYVNEFLQNKEFKNFSLDTEDYDDFCMNLNQRSQIIGKHKTILQLIKKIFRNNLIDDYFNIMFNEIIQIDKTDDEEETKIEMEIQELLLDIIGDFVKTDHKYQLVIEKYYHSHGNILDHYSLKAKFKVMDIVQLNKK